MKYYDVIIIGAGPAGLSFARSLKDSHLNVLVIEKTPLENIAEPEPDGREIALTHLSLKLMSAQNTWQRLPEESVSLIKAARVFNGDSSYPLAFDNKKDSLEALGYLVPNYQIRKAIYDEVVTQDNVEIIAGVGVSDINTNSETAIVTLENGDSYESAIAVASDSRFSETRRRMGIPAQMKDFSRTAIVCRMEHEQPHNSTAYECFFYGRTMAILPMNGNVSSVVITISSTVANTLMAMSEEEFNQDVQSHFHSRFGKMTLLDKRHAYPLVAVHASRFYANRFAVIGDAAVGMHPVTAHGFNLGLQGQDILAKEINNALARGKDIGSSEVLKRYNFKHQQATRPLYHGTNGIVGLFTSESMPAKLARKATLKIANNFFPLKNLITNKLTEVSESKKLPLPFFIH
jgi:ubiquinone biosynthesis UbiH/UbiF/VisC/COQ6 family hydroxylase